MKILQVRDETTNALFIALPLTEKKYSLLCEWINSQIEIKENKTRMRIYDIILLNLNNYTYPIEIIIQNGKFRSGNEAINYRAGADKEFDKVYKYYLKSLSDSSKPTDVW